ASKRSWPLARPTLFVARPADCSAPLHRPNRWTAVWLVGVQTVAPCAEVAPRLSSTFLRSASYLLAVRLGTSARPRTEAQAAAASATVEVTVDEESPSWAVSAVSTSARVSRSVGLSLAGSALAGVPGASAVSRLRAVMNSSAPSTASDEVWDLSVPVIDFILRGKGLRGCCVGLVTICAVSGTPFTFPVQRLTLESYVSSVGRSTTGV